VLGGPTMMIANILSLATGAVRFVRFNDSLMGIKWRWLFF
jgi:hypothetical protein